MGDNTQTMVKVIAAFITLLAEMNDALFEATASEEPRVAPERTEEVKVVFTPPLSEEEEEGWFADLKYQSEAIDEHQKRLDDFDAKHEPFEQSERNNGLYECSGCGTAGHTMGNFNRPCKGVF